MKPFNLEAAKAGAKLITRYGYSARILSFDLVGDYPIVAAIFHKEDKEDKGDNRELVSTHTNNGELVRKHKNIDNASEGDLFMAPIKTGAWMNIFSSGLSSHFCTKADADSMSKNRIACVYVEWEE